MIKGIIFDMDGVLIDSEPLWEKAATRYLKSIGVRLPSDQEFQQYVNTHIRGRKWKEVVAVFTEKLGAKESYEAITQGCLKELFIVFDKQLKLSPGTLNLLKLLKKNNYPMLLASSAPRKVINYVVKKFQLNKYIKYTYSGDNVTKGKPHPEIFLKSARKLKIPPSQIVIFEDSISGVRAAHRAGMKCIVLKQPYTQNKYLKTADLIVKKLSEVKLNTIKKL